MGYNNLQDAVTWQKTLQGRRFKAARTLGFSFTIDRMNRYMYVLRHCLKFLQVWMQFECLLVKNCSR